MKIFNFQVDLFPSLCLIPRSVILYETCHNNLESIIRSRWFCSTFCNWIRNIQMDRSRHAAVISRRPGSRWVYEHRTKIFTWYHWGWTWRQNQYTKLIEWLLEQQYYSNTKQCESNFRGVVKFYFSKRKF